MTTANVIVGPTTTGLVQGSTGITFYGLTIVASTAASVTVRVGSGSGPLIGQAVLAAAGPATIDAAGDGIYCATGIHVTITGTVTETGVFIS